MLPNRAADRFSNRAEEYDKYRPNYPEELFAALERHQALSPESVVVDIGSGTGILSRQIQARCAYLYAIEPNREMRKASLEHLRDFDHVVVLEGRAENTGLRQDSVDLIVAAQAFHWFDTFWTYEEWGRILRPHGRVALVWNERATGIDEFHQAYEQLLLDYGTDYRAVDHRRYNLSAIQQFLEPETLVAERFDHAQELDFAALKGRLLSSSYVPREEASNFEAMIQELSRIFEEYSTDGTVTMRYETKLYLGTLIENVDEDDEDHEADTNG
jgi:SAM-dependent methyltransferase